MQEKKVNILYKKGQITIFIIIAIIIVAAIAGYFLLKGRISLGEIPQNLMPVEQYYLDCIKSTSQEGIQMLGEKAGYINNPTFEPGSSYSPFSSQLNFNGIGVPYWYYIAGNNIIKEQVPSKSEMEKQLAGYIEENLDCDFSAFEEKGFSINVSESKVKASISELKVDIDVTSSLNIASEQESARVTSHKTSVDSKLGKFYALALKIYNYEKESMFLENYTIDVLRLYAPVDGVELSCAPKVWMQNDVDAQLKEALEANIQAVKAKGTYYTLAKPENKYFVSDVQSDEAVNFLYSRDWPSRIEIWGSNNGVLMATPVGTQAGLGVLGFCYVPYHFVYDIRYPVLVQIYDSSEIFQFPFAIIIEKNKPRQALEATATESTVPDLCEYKNADVSISTYNTNLDAVEAEIGFECLSQSCDIGKTKIENNNAVLEGKFPQCINGFITAKTDGYAEKRVQYSTNTEGSVDIVLDRLYNLTLNLKVDGEITGDYAILSFISESNSQNLVWPQQNTIQLSEGQYNISVYVYKNSSITIPAMNKEFCSEVPKSGLLGMLGGTEEKCFNTNIPAQTLSNIISAGGKGSDYFAESQLQEGKIEINVNSFPLPSSVEKLQDSYNILEVSPVYTEFKEK